jgi:hypothetical protein
MIKDKFTSVDSTLTDSVLLSYVHDILIEHNLDTDNIIVEDTNTVRYYDVTDGGNYISIAFLNDTKQYQVIYNNEDYFGEII